MEELTSILGSENVSLVRFSCEIDIIIRNDKLRYSDFENIILNLLPPAKVPNKIIEPIILWIIGDKFKTPKKMYLTMHWIIALIEYDLVEKECIASYYHFFISLLRRKRNLMNIICKMIYMLTLPEDVRRWLVELILDVHEKLGRPKCTNALLSLYKSMRPECVPEHIDTVPIEIAFGKTPVRLVEKFANVYHPLPDSLGAQYNSKVKLIPKCLYKNVKSSLYSHEKTPVTSARLVDVIVNSKKIHLPSNVISLISTLEGRRVLMFSKQHVIDKLSFYLYYMLKEEIISNKKLTFEPEVEEVFQCLADLSDLSFHGLPIISKFLSEYLQTWDGDTDSSVTRLIIWPTFQNFTELRYMFLTPLINNLYTSDAIKANKLLLIMMKMIENIFFGDIFRTVHKIRMPFGYRCKWSLYETAYAICEWANTFCSEAVRIHGRKMLSPALNFHERLCLVQLNSSLGLWSIAHPITAYMSIFSIHASDISRFCDILLAYKKLSRTARRKYVKQIQCGERFANDYYEHLINNYTEKAVTFVRDLRERNKSAMRRIKPSLNLLNHIAFVPYRKFFENNSETVDYDTAFIDVYFHNIQKFIILFQ